VIEMNEEILIIVLDIENHYRKDILYPHRKKHNYPEYSHSCILCTPCVSTIFGFINEQLEKKIVQFNSQEKERRI